jgi:hypothetical protein
MKVPEWSIVLALGLALLVSLIVFVSNIIRYYRARRRHYEPTTVACASYEDERYESYEDELYDPFLQALEDNQESQKPRAHSASLAFARLDAAVPVQVYLGSYEHLGL